MQAVLQLWLARQCELIPGATRGVVVVAGAEEGTFLPLACWPEGSPVPGELVATADASATRGQVASRELCGGPGGPVKQSHLAVPLRASKSLAGAVAIELAELEGREDEHVIAVLQSGMVGLEMAARSEESSRRPNRVLELAELALAHDRFVPAATALATALATRLGCERVSIGMLRRGQVRVVALSHSAAFGERSNLIRDLGVAMDEATDQDAVITYPELPDSPPRIVRKHEVLAQQHESGAACTVPLSATGEIVGAITFERSKDVGFDRDSVRLCAEISGVLGPILLLKRAADAGPLERAASRVRAHLTRLLGPEHTLSKLGWVALVAASVFLSFARGDYRVTADATLEGRVQRALVAGFEGYISEANARAGDLVRKGQILGRLDERTLRLERQKYEARREQHRKEYREAFASHDRAEMNVLSARIAQADAHLELLWEQLERARLVAPFDGVVVKGDLSQSLGSPVEKGDVLFEVAPLDGYRIILKVDERDISEVVVGQRGELALAALPGTPLALTITRSTPVASSAEGRNYFRFEARLEEPTTSLRPGMEGIAKVWIARRHLVWIWTHDLIDWLRLRVWAWWP